MRPSAHEKRPPGNGWSFLFVTGSETKISFLLIETFSKFVNPQNHGHPELIKEATYYSNIYSGCFQVVEDLITFIAVMVMILTHAGMAIIARDDSRAKGIEALFFLFCPPFALLYYMRMPKRKRKGFVHLNWIFLMSTAVVIYMVP